MSDLRELYQEVILDHNKRPRNFRVAEPHTHHADGYNPLCGDKVTIYVQVVDGVVEDVSFQGEGCAISTASASILTEVVKGKRIDEAQQLFERFHDLVTMDDASAGPELGKLAVLAGVKDYPNRVKCATLAWHTLHAALEERESISTE